MIAQIGVDLVSRDVTQEFGGRVSVIASDGASRSEIAAPWAVIVQLRDGRIAQMDRGATNMVRRVGIAGLLLGLAACSWLTRGDLRHEMEQVPPTAHALRDMRLEETAIGEKYEFDITSNSPVFEFPTGKSYYQAFELPTPTRAYDLVLKSVFLSERSHEFSFPAIYLMRFRGATEGESPGTVHPLRAFVYLPRVITLDEHFGTVRVFDADAFSVATDLRPLGTSSLSLPLGDTWLETAIRFEPDSKERYAVIFAKPALLDSKTRLPRDHLTGPYGEYWPWCRAAESTAFGLPLYSASPDCDFVYHSPLGRLKLSFAYP